jgi:hypothetical protein
MLMGMSARALVRGRAAHRLRQRRLRDASWRSLPCSRAGQRASACGRGGRWANARIVLRERSCRFAGAVTAHVAAYVRRRSCSRRLIH